MPNNTQPPWWRDLLRREAVGGHVVSTLVGLAVTFVVGLIVTAFWFIVAAWRDSYVWIQRSIGAAMAFAVVTVAVVVSLAILRLRLHSPSVNPAVAAKGHLDHQADSTKARAVIAQELSKITKITVQGTKWLHATTARLQKIYATNDENRLAKELAESRREARLRDKTTRKLSARIPSLAKAIETSSRSDVAYWRWHTANYGVDAPHALTLMNLQKENLASINEYLEAQVATRVETARRLGISQVLNEAIERRLEVVDRLCAAVASQREPIQEVIVLLEPFAKVPLS
jgi:hypothetical protein